MAFRDWEAGKSYRKYLRRYGQQGAEEKLWEWWFTGLFYPCRDIIENYQEELFSL